AAGKKALPLASTLASMLPINRIRTFYMVFSRQRYTFSTTIHHNSPQKCFLWVKKLIWGKSLAVVACLLILSSSQFLGTTPWASWEEVGRKLGGSWEQVGRMLGAGREEVGSRQGGSREQVGRMLGAGFLHGLA
ncbi:MAG: hypothetical protein SOV40_06205, partial [Prevotella sp.]|nr:hypothetical protein [Prevotella sp.]